MCPVTEVKSVVPGCIPILCPVFLGSRFNQVAQITEWNKEMLVRLETVVVIIWKFFICTDRFLALGHVLLYSVHASILKLASKGHRLPISHRRYPVRKLTLQRYELSTVITVEDIPPPVLPSCWTTGEEDSRRIITSSLSALDPSCQASSFSLQTLGGFPQWSAGRVISCLDTRRCGTQPTLNVWILPVSFSSLWNWEHELNV